MKSMRALKRKSKKSPSNKENISMKSSESCPNLKNVIQHPPKIRKTKSESDIAHSSLEMITPDIQFHAKSVRNLKSVYVNDEINSTTTTTSTTPADSRHRRFMSSTPIIDNIMQASTFSVISDQEQLKIPIVGYEVMEERSRFTVSTADAVKICKQIGNSHFSFRFSSFASKTTKRIVFGSFFGASPTSLVSMPNSNLIFPHRISHCPRRSGLVTISTRISSIRE